MDCFYCGVDDARVQSQSLASGEGEEEAKQAMLGGRKNSSRWVKAGQDACTLWPGLERRLVANDEISWVGRCLRGQTAMADGSQGGRGSARQGARPQGLSGVVLRWALAAPGTGLRAVWGGARLD